VEGNRGAMWAFERRRVQALKACAAKQRAGDQASPGWNRWNGSILPMQCIGEMPVPCCAFEALQKSEAALGCIWASDGASGGGVRDPSRMRVTGWADPCPPLAAVAFEGWDERPTRQRGRTRT
jgi:hypothetical protein